jgi:hypothetical protein
MRYRHVVLSLSLLLGGCSSLCPIRHFQQSPAAVEEGGLRAQPGTTATVGPLPVPIEQPISAAPATPTP